MKTVLISMSVLLTLGLIVEPISLMTGTNKRANREQSIANAKAKMCADYSMHNYIVDTYGSDWCNK